MNSDSRRAILKGVSVGFASAATLSLPKLGQSASSQDFSFVLIGDTPYTKLDEYSASQVIQQASISTSFIIHVGDIKTGRDLCTDELITRRIKLIDESPIPLVYLPGDNEWVDCRFTTETPYDPENRLQLIRKLAFSSEQSLGVKKITTQFQSEFPEHRLWNQGEVTFLTLNVQGSYNGHGVLSQAAIDTRMQAVRTWLELGVSKAIQSQQRGLVVALHANIGVSSRGFSALRGRGATAYGDFRQLLTDQFKRWNKPCLLLHGDSHTFANDKPIEALPLLQRVESFGFPFTSSWARISVVHQNPALFVVSANHL
jgi:hypothetical protein